MFKVSWIYHDTYHEKKFKKEGAARALKKELDRKNINAVLFEASDDQNSDDVEININSLRIGKKKAF